MVQKIKQANIFGRIGTGVGKGFAEQIPKEIERGRLAYGLKELGKKKNLTPFQQFAGLAGTPGITPQMIQSGSELLRQQGIAEGFRNNSNQAQQEQNPLRAAVENKSVPSSPPGQQPESKGLVQPETTEAALRPYIPKTRDELLSRAADLYDQNRQLYPNPEMAFNAAVQEDQQNQAINNAQKGARSSAKEVETNARDQLQQLRNSANVQIPDNVFQQVENDVLNSIEGGRKELEAIKDGQKTLDKISRQYNDVNGLGNLTFMLKSPSASKRSLEASRENFKKRDDLENFALTMVSKNGLSYPKAYSIAYDINDYPNIKKEISSLPRLHETKTQDPAFETRKIAPKLAEALKGSGGSPLAIAEEIRMLGYDPDTWMDYVSKNKEKLNLSLSQDRELPKPRNWFPALNDLWFFIGTGKNKYVED